MLATLHVGILFLAVAAVLFADHEAFGYLTGRTPLLDRRRTLFLHHSVWALLFGMVATGTLMIAPEWQRYLSVPLFQAKLFFVGVLFLNAFVIQGAMHHAFETPFSALSRKTRFALMFSGAVSTISWLGAISLGLYLFG